MRLVIIISKVKLFLQQADEAHRVLRRLGSYIFKTQLRDGGVVRLTHQPRFTPQEVSWYSFLLETESTPRPECSWKESIKNPMTSSGDGGTR
jgi:predicted metal-dependent RNase